MISLSLNVAPVVDPESNSPLVNKRFLYLFDIGSGIRMTSEGARYF